MKRKGRELELGWGRVWGRDGEGLERDMQVSRKQFWSPGESSPPSLLQQWGGSLTSHIPRKACLSYVRVFHTNKFINLDKDLFPKNLMIMIVSVLLVHCLIIKTYCSVCNQWTSKPMIELSLVCDKWFWHII